MDEGRAGVGLKIKSSEQVQARSAVCERPLLILGLEIVLEVNGLKVFAW